MNNRFLRGIYLGDADVDVPIWKVLLVSFFIIGLIVAFVLLSVEFAWF